MLFAALGTVSAAHALPPHCRNVSAALEPYDVIESASVIVGVLDSMDLVTDSSSDNPFRHQRWHKTLRERAAVVSKFANERVASGEYVSPDFLRAMERLQDHPEGLSYNERRETVREIHEWIDERRRSRVGQPVLYGRPS